jgi:hypothetical protein
MTCDFFMNKQNEFLEAIADYLDESYCRFY